MRALCRISVCSYKNECVCDGAAVTGLHAFRSKRAESSNIKIEKLSKDEIEIVAILYAMRWMILYGEIE